MKRFALLFFTMTTLWVVMAFSVYKTEQGKFVINIMNMVGEQPLKMDTETYKNALGQAFTVTNFKYYIGNIVLKNKEGKEFRSADYFLVNEDDIDSKKIMLNNIPDGTYTSIRFTLGVDSLHNCSGAQSGSLDAVNGMFWAWNTGYIFLKLEGKSPASTAPGHIFEYHIGGYKAPNNCIREIKLNTNELVIAQNKISQLTLKADAAEVLKTPESIDFLILPSVTDFHHATAIADNYKDMFSILNSTNEK